MENDYTREDFEKEFGETSTAEDTAEKSEETTQETTAEDTAEKSTEDNEELTEETTQEALPEDTAEKSTEQTPEERAKYADLNRKKELRELREREKALLDGETQAYTVLNEMGIPGANLREQLQTMKALNQQRQQQALQQQAEETGVSVDILTKAAKVDEYEKMIATQEQQKVRQTAEIAFNRVADYFAAKGGNYFDDVPQTDRVKVSHLIAAGYEPKEIYNIYHTDKTSPGIAHVKPVGSKTNKSSAINIPPDIMKEYARYGYSKADAIADYTEQMKGKNK